MFLKHLRRYLLTYHYSSLGSSFHIAKEIKIPNKIYRDNLSVLKALSNIVKVESSSPFYPLVDDPNLSHSVSNATSRKYLLSKASGRFSAQLAFNEKKYDFLNIAKEEPKIKILRPKLSPKEITNKLISKLISPEKALELLINLLKSTEAWKFYQENKSNQSFSPEITQELLDLLCCGIEFNNNSLETQPEEFYFSNETHITWNNDNEAEMLFQSLEMKTKQAYESMIMGASKGKKPIRALEFFKELRSAYPDYFPSRKACNLLLRGLESFHGPDHILIDHLMGILAGMNFYKISPDVHTFNNAIFAINQRNPMIGAIVTSELIEKLYTEMRYLDIEPTLGTFCLIFQSKNFRKDKVVAMVNDLIGFLSERKRNKVYEQLYSKDDMLLFRYAMQSLNESRSWELAWKLNDIALGGGYTHLIGKNFDTYKYFQALFNILINEVDQDPDQLIKQIKYAVPNYFNFTPFLANSLLELILVKDSFLLLPEILDLIQINGRAYSDSDIVIRIMKAIANVFDRFEGTTNEMNGTVDRATNQMTRSVDRATNQIKGTVDRTINQRLGVADRAINQRMGITDMLAIQKKGTVDAVAIQKLRKKISNSLNRIFQITFRDSPKILLDPKLISVFVDLIDKLEDFELTWKFIRFYGDYGRLLPSSIRVLMESFYRQNDFDSAMELMEYLLENDSVAIDNIINLPDEQAKFESMMEYFKNVMKPVFAENGVSEAHVNRIIDNIEYNVTKGRKEKLQVESDMDDDDGYSMSESSSSDDDTDDDDDDDKDGESDDDDNKEDK